MQQLISKKVMTGGADGNFPPLPIAKPSAMTFTSQVRRLPITSKLGGGVYNATYCTRAHESSVSYGGTIDYYQNNTLVFSHGVSSFAAGASGIVRFSGLEWYDNVDDLFYVVTTDIANDKLYLDTVTRSGTVATQATIIETDLGFSTSFNHTNRYQWWERAAHGSGDFSIYKNNEVATINAAGVVTGPATPFLLSGQVVSLGGYFGYLTEDKKIRVGHLLSGPPYNIGIQIQRGNGGGTVMLPMNSTFGMPRINPGGNGGMMKPWVWDEGVVISIEGINPGQNSDNWAGPKYFERSDFDDWLHKLADYGGIGIVS